MNHSQSIEALRKDGEVGSSLQVKLNLWLDGDQYDAVLSLGDELRFIMLTSEATLGRLEDVPAEAQRNEAGNLALTVTPSEADKCVRCWHYREDVGSIAEHPELCARCVENVDGAGEVRRIG